MSTIENDHDREPADRPAEQIAIDVSVNLDLEDAKINDSEDNNKDGSELHHHARSNSLAKRPTGFKAVSVTKSFLARAGAPLPSVGKPSDDKGFLNSIDRPNTELTFQGCRCHRRTRAVKVRDRALLQNPILGNRLVPSPWVTTTNKVDQIRCKCGTKIEVRTSVENYNPLLTVSNSYPTSYSETIHRRRAQTTVWNSFGDQTTGRRRWQGGQVGRHRR